ncbi:phosphatase PAP2 family protein [Modestobacter altitudinis]|uniref:phosphatase PAP2 family protein n=1 Tax=Modestobacter altitudinis TaxID=2213158 RepID=UPI00110CE996|nr:phosphatase PAP2 family protein [Modestobacter altitudinis]
MTVPTGLPGVGRFTTRALLGLAGVVLGAVPFLVLLVLVQSHWAPLAGLDGDVAGRLNEVVSTSPATVGVLSVLTDLGGTGTAVFLHLVLAGFLWVRGRRRLTCFVVASGVGLALIVPLAKALVDRARPVVASPVVDLPSNASFPSGHAMTSLVTWGVLACVLAPGVGPRARPWVFVVASVVVVVVGLTRLALGVHFVTDVLAGWAIGLAWLAACTSAFRVWQTDRRVAAHEAWDPLRLEPDPSLAAAPLASGTASPTPRTWLRVTGVAVVLLVLLSGAGVLVTQQAGALLAMDVTVVRWFAEHRSAQLTDLARAVSQLSGTRTVVMGALAAAALGLAVSSSWRPVRFVTVTVLGEVVLYFLVAQVVERARPGVPDLTHGLPTGASWPSGHVTAAMALYGAAAVLYATYTRGRSRWAVLAVPLLVALAVATSRLYVAAHHPTDVVAGLVLGGTWTAACAWLLLPECHHPGHHVATSRPAVPGGRPTTRRAP